MSVTHYGGYSAEARLYRERSQVERYDFGGLNNMSLVIVTASNEIILERGAW